MSCLAEAMRRNSKHCPQAAEQATTRMRSAAAFACGNARTRWMNGRQRTATCQQKTAWPKGGRHERSASHHLPGPARRDRVESHGPAHRTDRIAPDRARRAQGQPAWATAERTDVRNGSYQSLAVRSPDRRAASSIELL